MCQRLTAFSLLIAALLSGCGYNDLDRLPHAANQRVTANLSIGQLHEWYDGEGVRLVGDDFVIGGHVTADDKSDNFYRSFVIQDATGAIEVRAGNTVFMCFVLSENKQQLVPLTA